MFVDVISTVDEIRHENLYKKTIIIVDILRTSTTIITALANGGKWIIPVETLGQAKTMKTTEKDTLLAGDRFSKKIQDFDLGNSPIDFISPNIQDKKIILSTTDGTRAVLKAGKGDFILIGGFLNGESCIKKAIELKRDLVVLCVGNNSQFALEDGLAAGYLLDILYRSIKIEVNDFGKAMYGMYKYYQNNLTDTLKNTESGKKLIKIGLIEDIEFSSQIDYYTICPIYEPSLNKIKPSSV